MSNDHPAIHIYEPRDQAGTWEVWLDPDDAGEKIGLCIGVGDSREAALLNAEVSLRQVTKRLEWMRTEKLK